MNWSKQELKKIRSNLPPGSIAVLAEKFGFKTGSIRNILSGLSKNEEVVLEALKMAVDHQQLINKNREALKTL